MSIDKIIRKDAIIYNIIGLNIDTYLQNAIKFRNVHYSNKTTIFKTG